MKELLKEKAPRALLCLALALALACGGALAEAGLGDFTAADMEGNEVTRAIFADYDLTLVNVWATWCPYCIEEMPQFAALKDRLPENVNFLTVCTDADVEPELAAQILEEAGANYQTLVPDAALAEQISALVYAFPTTLFLDSEGNGAAEPLVGALRTDDLAGAYCEIAEGVLGMLEKAA